MTKAVDSATLERLMGLMSLERRSGRAKIAPDMEKQDPDVCFVGAVDVCWAATDVNRQSGKGHRKHLTGPPSDGFPGPPSAPRSPRGPAGSEEGWHVAWDDEAERLLKELEEAAAADGEEEDKIN